MKSNNLRFSLYFLILTTLLSNIASDIIVRSPLEVSQKFTNSTIKTSYATFGHNPYGYIITGRVYYDPVNIDQELACDYDKIKDLIPEKDKTTSIDNSPIIMVDRGSCHFTVKARNIQKAGGKIAVVINNNDNDIKNIVMSDDGTGDDITIPLVLISKTDGKILKDYYSLNRDNKDALKKFILDVDFQIEHPNNKAKVDFFMNSESDELYELIDKMYYFSEILDYVDLTPYYLTFPNIGFNPNLQVNQRTEVKDCLGGGKYCPRPFYSQEPFTAMAVLKENLLQKCIWKYATEQNNIRVYIDYLSVFYWKCFKTTDKDGVSNFSIECGKGAMEIIGLPSKQIEECFAKSFQIPENTTPAQAVNMQKTVDNDIFNYDNQMRKEFGVKLMPSIFVNKIPYWGTFEPKTVLEAICSGILKKPKICYEEGGFNKRYESNSSFTKIFLIILAIVFTVSFVVFLICKNRLKAQVTDQLHESDIDLKVNTVVTSYLALKDKS